MQKFTSYLLVQKEHEVFRKAGKTHYKRTHDFNNQDFRYIELNYIFLAFEMRFLVNNGYVYAYDIIYLGKNV